MWGKGRKNREKGEKIISIIAEKLFNKFQYLFMIRHIHTYSLTHSLRNLGIGP